MSGMKNNASTITKPITKPADPTKSAGLLTVEIEIKND